MQLKSLLLPATLAWSATAMLMPPGTTGDAIQALEASAPESVNVLMPVRLHCEQCPVAEKTASGIWQFHDPSADESHDLVVPFEMRDGAIYNGPNQIFPAVSPFTIVGKQINSEDETPIDFEANDILHFSSHVEVGPAMPLDESGSTLSKIDIELLGFDNDEVVHVGTIEFGLIEKEEDGKRISTMSVPQVIPTVTTLLDATCTTVLCRIKAQMLAKAMAAKAAVMKAAGKVKAGCMKMMGMRPPHGHMMHGHGHKHQEAGDSNVVDRLKGGPAKFAGKMGMHGKKPCKGGFVGRMMHGFVLFTRHILMPVLIGIAAGMAVSAVGMVVGQLICMIYMRLRGRRNGGYVAVYHVIENSEDDDEDVERGDKDEEQLPLYEAGDHVLPPAYTDEKSQTEN